MRGYQEHDLGEPVIYGGYGSGANRSQRSVVKEAAEDSRVQGKPVRCVCMETMRTFPTVKAAASCYGVAYKTLANRLRERGSASVGGLTFRYAEEDPAD